MTELKKCPFCGGEAEFATNHKRWVQCKKCLAESDYCDTPEQAIAAWNKRKPVEDVLERLEGLAEQCMNNSEKSAELGQEYEKHIILNDAKRIAFEQAIEIIKEELME